jgi:predicted transglutaminase-like cysteine proteinase
MAPIRFRSVAVSAVAVAALLSISCGASVDAVAALEPVDVVTGWYDDGIIAGGKNRLVPSVTMKLRNKTDKPLNAIQINAIFRRVGEQEMWGEYFGWAIPRTEPLAPGAETRALVMRSTLGYTGEQPRMQMLQNKDFVDAKVEIYLKQGSKVLAKLAEYPIQRQLLTRSSEQSSAPKAP